MLELKGCTSDITRLEFAPGELLLASTEKNFPIVRLWDVGRQRQLHLLPGLESEVQDITFSPDGDRLAGVDILRSNHGSVVMEVNSSPGLEGIEQATGKDVAGIIIEFIEKNAKPNKTQTRGKG